MSTAQQFEQASGQGSVRLHIKTPLNDWEELDVLEVSLEQIDSKPELSGFSMLKSGGWELNKTKTFNKLPKDESGVWGFKLDIGGNLISIKKDGSGVILTTGCTEPDMTWTEQYKPKVF